MDALIVIFITGLIGLFVGMMKKPVLSLSISVLGLISAFILMLYYKSYESPFGNYDGLNFTPAGNLFALLVIGLTLLVILSGFNYFKRDVDHTADYYGLILFSLCGALIMIGFTNFFMFFLGLEIMSIPVYVLVGIRKQNTLASEASIKYFFTGSFATAVLLFGIALVYGAIGSFDLNTLSMLTKVSPMFHVGVLLILAAFLFKVGAVPFHFWSPDVYQGSTDAVMSYMSTVVKVAALYSFLTLFGSVLGASGHIYTGILEIVIIASFFLGYVSALKQSNFKRLLAYSGISNTGFALLSVFNGDFGSLWIFLLGYTASTITLLTVSQAIEKLDSEDVKNWKGIGYKNPFIGVVVLISFLSLAGIPPLTGFFGKLLLLSGTYLNHMSLVILALISSVIGAFLYLRFIINVFAKESHSEKIIISPIHIIVILVSTFVSLLGWTIILF